MTASSHTSNEDAGPQTFNLIASAAAGPATATDENATDGTGQTITFQSDATPVITSGNLVLTSFAVSDAGELSYTAAPNTSGTAIFGLFLTDNVTPVHPLDDNTTDPVQITINVTPQPDPPTAVTPNYVCLLYTSPSPRDS